MTYNFPPLQWFQAGTTSNLNESKRLEVTYDQTKAWDAPENLAIARWQPDPLICPSVPQQYRHDAMGRFYTAYATLIGPTTAFPNGVGLPTNKFSDGTSHTVLVVEACGQQIVWTEPRDIELTDQNLAINLPGSQPGQSSAGWSSYHTGVVHSLFADGSVRTLHVNTDRRVLRAITTPASGDSSDDF